MRQRFTYSDLLSKNVEGPAVLVKTGNISDMGMATYTKVASGTSFLSLFVRKGEEIKHDLKRVMFSVRWGIF